MTQFIVTRHGSNKANQSMTQKMIVGTVEAENEAEAKTAAAATFNCYNNQWVSVQMASQCSPDEQLEAFEADQARALEDEAFTG